MTDRNKKEIHENTETIYSKSTLSMGNIENLDEVSNDERHNENARASAALELDYPRINTDNL